MPSIRIHGTELPYNLSDTVTFEEGLIGLPKLRRMVIVRRSDISPFLWFASLGDQDAAFLVVNPAELFPDYRPSLTEELRVRIGVTSGQPPLVLAIASIDNDWEKSTVNLRAPLFINPDQMRGAQAALVGSSYKLNEPLPACVEPKPAGGSNT